MLGAALPKEMHRPPPAHQKVLRNLPSEAKSGSQSPGGDPLSPSLSIFLLVLNVGNGWVAGGCWDDYETSDDLWIIPENSLRKTHQ